ncbi:MAG TPA: hypothetical protein VLB47_02155, partial [Solirubrobacteraceae bacterium]|nr:hypothetical protein [Solirubrobacteraceae bacterium]
RAAARVLVAACLLVAIAARAPAVHQDVARAAVAVTRLDGLDAAVARAGGPPGIAACGGAATAQPYRARLAWDLRLPTAAVLRAGRRGLVFLPPGPRTAPLPLRHPGAVRVRRALRVAGWTVLRVTARAPASAARAVRPSAACAVPAASAARAPGPRRRPRSPARRR